MDLYFTVKTLHVIGATVLLGTGAGIAFFMLMANRTQSAVLIAHTAGTVVIADFIFIASAVIIQPITGAWLIGLAGYSWHDGWIVVSLILYVVTGAFWLPVVRMQRRMRDLARAAAAANEPLPAQYNRLYRTWFLFGIPAFSSVVAIVWLMVAKPGFTL
jgi:uncharacterized membrane protein